MSDSQEKQGLTSQQQESQQSGKKQSIADTFNEVMHPSAAHWKILVFEFFGTMIFAHGIIASNGSDFLVAASLFAALIFTCKHSGGHVNPAVSTGFLCLDPEDKEGQSINTGRWFCYVIAQLFGAFCGGYLALFVLGEAGAPWITQQEVNWIIADTLGEFIGTFTFVLTILIMTDKRTQYNHQGIYILVTIATALFFSRQFSVHSGGCLNPAIGLGLELMMWINSGQNKYIRRSYVYIIGPICGGVAAGCFYRYFWLPRKIESEQPPVEEQQLKQEQEQEQE